MFFFRGEGVRDVSAVLSNILLNARLCIMWPAWQARKRRKREWVWLFVNVKARRQLSASFSPFFLFPRTPRRLRAMKHRLSGPFLQGIPKFVSLFKDGKKINVVKFQSIKQCHFFFWKPSCQGFLPVSSFGRTADHMILVDFRTIFTIQ